MKLSVDFHAVGNDEAGAQAADDEAEPVIKKSRLDSDFEQLVEPHFEIGCKEPHSTPAAKLHAYSM